MHGVKLLREALLGKKRRDFSVERPWPRPREHHDEEPYAIECLRQTEQVIEPIGAIKRLPRRNPPDGVACESPETNHEDPESPEHRERTGDWGGAAADLHPWHQPLHDRYSVYPVILKSACQCRVPSGVE